MLANLKYFARHSIIYSVSNVAAKAIGVVLLPLYTKYISLSEFGILGILEVTLLIAVEFLNLGQGQSLVMLNNSQEYLGKRKSMLFSITSFSVIVCLVFILLSEALLPSISKFFSEPSEFYNYLRLCVYIISLRLLNSLFLNKVRADERSILYTGINLLKLSVSLGFAVYFVAFAKIGILGVFYSYLIAELLIFIILLPLMIPHMSVSFDKKLVLLSIRFGIPLIFGSLAMMLLNVSDRYILKLYTNYATVGLYDLGYRIAGVLNMFLIMPFTLALMPLAYQFYGKDGDKRYYTKIMTYLTFILVWAGLALSMFGKEIIKVFALNTQYWNAYHVVPIVVFSYVFFGMRIVASLGMFLTKNTKYVAYTTTAASLFNIGLNFWWIPIFGMMGAAYSTLISFVLLHFVTNYYSNKYYKIPYENSKLAMCITIGVVLYLISSQVNDFQTIVRFPVKIILVFLFPFILYVFKFYEQVELSAIQGFFLKWKNPSVWKDTFNSEMKKVIGK
ncbi:MAG: oligosaccharide flippase family protein [Ignavibacteriales bacterium]|nr:oligosaccharide flippase family protein [Ignavibacteriales bacterium]